jgi:uncharacterized protein
MLNEADKMGSEVRAGGGMPMTRALRRSIAHLAVVVFAVAALATAGCSGGSLNSRESGRQPDPNTLLRDAMDRQDIDALRTLLKRGASANYIDAERPVLWYAINTGNVILVRELLEAGADVHRRTTAEGDSMLGTAAYAGSVPVIRALLRAGANPNERFRGTEQLTPLGMAALGDRGMACSALIEAGADPDGWNLWPNRLYGEERHVHGVPRGRTALMIAASYGYVRTAALLIYHGADPSLKNERGQTALDLTAEYQNPIDELRRYLRRPGVVTPSGR